MASIFDSVYTPLHQLTLPKFSGIRVMMMPINISKIDLMPAAMRPWKNIISDLFSAVKMSDGIGYVTIDEKIVHIGQTHRRRGLHVDGVFNNGPGKWGGGGGSWGAKGFITVASTVGCRAWNQQGIVGSPGPDGEADHLKDQLLDNKSELLQPNVAYLVDGLCIHESITQPQTVARQFVRLSLPNNAPWFEGYTPNTMGVLPEGPILPRRKYMDTTEKKD